MCDCPGGCHEAHHRHQPLPERGWIQFLLLLLLNEEPMHGYQLISTMEERGLVKEGRFKTGSVYTILNRMEENGLLRSSHEESDAGRTRRIYEITGEGRGHLKTGLEYMLRRKRFLDHMEEYYRRHFPEPQPDRGKEDDA
ncbi:MAG TPA: PadR family transcriptional regulator [Candidatus Desulfaltia sp.]|nr:PadR family transcriptional regulator [Candidatus Desulfaltia sp.]